VQLDLAFAGKGEGVGRFGGAGAGEMGVMGIMGVMRVGGANRGGVVEQAAEDAGEEVREGPTSNIQLPQSNGRAKLPRDEGRMQKEECRMMKGRAESPKATLRLPRSHPQAIW
jgi:hypothetical protein